MRKDEQSPISLLVAARLFAYAECVAYRDVFVELVPQTPHEKRRTSPRTWQPVRPEEATRLTDSRLQLHHAAQFAAAAGISFLQPLPDDSHANLEWVPALGGLFSRVIPAGTEFRIGVKPVKLGLLIASGDNRSLAEYHLHGRTITEAKDWIRSQLNILGADGSRYTLTRNYEIPRHDVAIGDSFDASEPSRFEELARWLSNGAAMVGSLTRSAMPTSDVRCWPHHLDIGTQITVSPGRNIGVRLELGDQYYDEPYFYVRMNPQPAASRIRSRPLWGSGVWHTKDWVGAVLPGSYLGGASSQERQTREFLDSAVAASLATLTLS